MNPVSRNPPPQPSTINPIPFPQQKVLYRALPKIFEESSLQLFGAYDI